MISANSRAKESPGQLHMMRSLAIFVSWPPQMLCNGGQRVTKVEKSPLRSYAISVYLPLHVVKVTDALPQHCNPICQQWFKSLYKSSLHQKVE